ncbi:MAG: hypothetical protein EXX96DRAFT_583094 [Benjaminiella poitrasii]|nr:MAG: hypothetical protein EXX96DRAFT_583094 [Benjaminiella poitrasii]
MSKSKLKYTNEDEESLTITDDDEPSESDVVRCICKDSSDVGLTIQCDSCGNWQHASCMNIKKYNIPEHYVCNYCIAAAGNEEGKQYPLSLDSFEPSSASGIKDPKKLVKRNNNTVKSKKNDSQQQVNKRFVNLSKNVYKQKFVQNIFLEVHRQWVEYNKARHGKIKATTSPPPSTTATKSLESIVVMESNMLLPAIPKTSIRPLRKSLRKSFHQANQSPSATTEKGVFADIHIPEHRYLMEVTGELLRKSDYRNNTANKFSIIGTPLAHVFFYRAIDVCIDARHAGNDARYIRRSCHPNSEIKNIILPNDNDDRTIHMGIYTSEDVDKGEEITIGWNWHRGVLMWHKHKEFLRKKHIVSVNTAERELLKETLRVIEDEIGECACEDKDECLIECLKDELDKEEQHTLTTTKKRRPSITTHKSQDTTTIKRPKKSITSTTTRTRTTSPLDNPPTLKDNKNVTFKSPITTVLPSLTDNYVRDQVADSIVESTLLQSTISSSLFPADKAKLPSKKRWLLEFTLHRQEISQSKKEEESTLRIDSSNTATILPEVKKADVESIDYNDEEDELSDGVSSQSTLPLEDTPEAFNHQFNQTAKVEEQTTEPYVKPEHTALTETIMKMNPSVQLALQDNETSNESDEQEVKKAPKKLSIQEYLSMRRGNLPTPFEKS